MTKKLRVGDRIEGFYQSYFGQDGYAEVIETGKFKGERWALFSVTGWATRRKENYLVVLQGAKLKAVEREAEEQIEGLWEEE